MVKLTGWDEQWLLSDGAWCLNWAGEGMAGTDLVVVLVLIMSKVVIQKWKEEGCRCVGGVAAARAGMGVDVTRFTSLHFTSVNVTKKLPLARNQPFIIKKRR